MKLKVLSVEHLEECLKDQYNRSFDKMDEAVALLERFMEDYSVKRSDVITSLALTIYLDKAICNNNRSVVNRIKATIKDVEYRATVDTN